ncbi:MAG: HU family DNA-binding protein [Myxococcales bacterium]
MLKSDLITILVQKRGITQKQAESTVETIFESMKDALCKGENIEIRGLGAFHVKHYDGYQGRNPKTGQVIPVKPKRGILFRTGKELRDRFNRSIGTPLVPDAPEPLQNVIAPVAAATGTDEPTGGTQTGS